MPDYQLFLGDCLDILPTFEANSLDSIVCDPRLNVMLPNNREVVSLALCKCSLLNIVGSIANLNRGEDFIGIKAGIGVPECSVDFNERVGFGQVEIVGEAAEPKLPSKSNVLLSVFGGYFCLKLIERLASSPVCNLLCGKGCVATSGLWIGKLPNVCIA